MMRSICGILLLMCTVLLLASCTRQGVEVGDMTQEAIQIIHLGEALDSLMDRITTLEEENR